jgi:hypothetical protein
MSLNEKPKIGVDIIFFDGEDYGEHEDVDNPPLERWPCKNMVVPGITVLGKKST